jgi:Methyltransferase domain
MNSESPPSPATLSVTHAYSETHYHEIRNQHQIIGEYARRRRIEEELLVDQDEFFVRGYCYLTSRYTDLKVVWDRTRAESQSRVPHWRETLVSDGLYNNRMRASIHLFEKLLRPRHDDRIYLTEQYSPVYRWLKERYPNTTGSEYLGAHIAHGSLNKDGVRNESLTALTFPDRSMRFVLSFDCFEHFADYESGLRECARVLEPGGGLMITVPFRRDCGLNLIRARDKDDGTVEHLLPAEYHGDPLNPAGCLCYSHFGWELLGDMESAGFREPRACLYWSREFGYLGIEQILFLADKD